MAPVTCSNFVAILVHVHAIAYRPSCQWKTALYLYLFIPKNVSSDAALLSGVSTPTLDNIVRTALAMQENRPEPLRNQEVVISPDLAGELAVKKAALLKSVDGEVDAKESERLSDRSSTSTSQVSTYKLP